MQASDGGAGKQAELRGEDSSGGSEAHGFAPREAFTGILVGESCFAGPCAPPSDSNLGPSASEADNSIQLS